MRMTILQSSDPRYENDLLRVHPVHGVDEILPPARLIPLALQHVLVMYAGAVAVPLIIGRALKLSPQDVAYLISADLFACGLATLIQSVGLPYVGIRLPVMMGVTFVSVGPMLSMAAAPISACSASTVRSLPRDCLGSSSRLSSAGCSLYFLPS
jgi:xanthine/uracil permease